MFRERPENAEDYARYMVRGGGTIFASTAAIYFTGIIVRILMARALPSEEYGLFFAIVAFISLFTVLQDMGTNGAVVRFLPKFRVEGKLNDIKSTIYTSLTLQACFTAAICAALIASSEWLSKSFFGSSLARPVLIIMVAWFGVMMVIRFLESVFRGFRDMLGARAPELSRTIITLALVAAITFFTSSSSIEEVAVAFLIGSVVSASAFYIILQRRHSELLEGKSSISLGQSKVLLSFGLPLIMAASAGMVIAQTDTLMITAFRSLNDVGLYQVAMPLSRILALLAGVIVTPLLPMVSEFWAKDEKKLLDSSLKLITKLAFIVAIPAALILMAFPEIAIRLLFGAKYIAASNALRILSAGMIFFVGGSIAATTLIGIGSPWLNFKAMGAAACFNIIANYLLVPHYGVEGAAVATSFSFLLMFILRFHFLGGVIEFSIPAAAIVKAMAGAGLSLLAIWSLKLAISLHPWLEFFFVMTLGLLIYALWACRFGAVTGADIDTLARATPIPENIISVLKRLT